MDLKIQDQWFLVGGASDGLGKAIAERLLDEGAGIIAVARREAELKLLSERNPVKVKYIAADLSQPETLSKIKDAHDIENISGILLNAGGPPAKTFLETGIEDWDKAYQLLLRWKIQITRLFLPGFIKNRYGRFLFLESMSVKQAVPNLVLSNSLRMSVAGMVKTVATEVAEYGVTLNLIGPGYHDTGALQRLIRKKSEQDGKSYEEAKDTIVHEIPTGFPGDPHDFASLAVWLLSPLSKYVTGQVFFVDGGMIRSTL